MNKRNEFKDMPNFHGGGSQAYSIDPALADFLAENLQEGQRTLETGAGQSTLLFAMAGCEHVCVTPSADEVERIRRYCATNEIDLSKVTFHVGYSQDIVPHLDLADLDLYLIDGGHGFPIPFIDWYYGARRMKKGGCLIIDDCQISTGWDLMRFLRADPSWGFVRHFGFRCYVFQLNEEFTDKEWVNQPYVMRKSYSSRARRLALYSGSLILSGRFGFLLELIKKAIRNRRV